MGRRVLLDNNALILLLDDPEINVDKRRFDTFHFAAARIRDLELVSEDSDIVSLRQLHERLTLNPVGEGGDV